MVSFRVKPVWKPDGLEREIELLPRRRRPARSKIWKSIWLKPQNPGEGVLLPGYVGIIMDYIDLHFLMCCISFPLGRSLVYQPARASTSRFSQLCFEHCPIEVEFIRHKPHSHARATQANRAVGANEPCIKSHLGGVIGSNGAYSDDWERLFVAWFLSWA